MNWFLKVLKDYATFTGRARRKEYWMFTLFYYVFALVAALLDNAFGITFYFGQDAYGQTMSLYYGPIYCLFGLAMFLPSLAVFVRRLHDVNKSGTMILWLFAPLIPYIVLFGLGMAFASTMLLVLAGLCILGVLAIVIWLLVLLVTEGTQGANKYGPDPKEEELPAATI